MDIKNYFMQAAVVTAIKTGALKTGAAVAIKTGALKTGTAVAIKTGAAVAFKTGALKTGAAVAMKTGMLGAFGLPFLGIVAVAGGLYGITKLFDDSVQTKQAQQKLKELKQKELKQKVFKQMQAQLQIDQLQAQKQKLQQKLKECERKHEQFQCQQSKKKKIDWSFDLFPYLILLGIVGHGIKNRKNKSKLSLSIISGYFWTVCFPIHCAIMKFCSPYIANGLYRFSLNRIKNFANKKPELIQKNETKKSNLVV